MKNLDLKAYGVVAMPKQEMQKADGGVAWYLIIAASVASIEVYDCIADFCEGWNERMDAERNRTK